MRCETISLQSGTMETLLWFCQFGTTETRHRRLSYKIPQPIAVAAPTFSAGLSRRRQINCNGTRDRMKLIEFHGQQFDATIILVIARSGCTHSVTAE